MTNTNGQAEEVREKDVEETKLILPIIEELEYFYRQGQRPTITEFKRCVQPFIAAEKKAAWREERERILAWGMEPCVEHLGDLMDGVLTHRECPVCWRSLSDKEAGR